MKLIEQCTPAAEFYCNWFRGFRSVATGKLNNAKEHYKNAFAARRFAGCQFERFIKQAFALSCYADFNADKVRDSAEKDKKSRSPLSTDDKKYWKYGYAVGVFDRKAEDTHQILFHRVENILTYFGTSLFPENSEFYRDLKQQINGFKEEPKKEEEVKGVLDQPRELKDIDKYSRLLALIQQKIRFLLGFRPMKSRLFILQSADMCTFIVIKITRNCDQKK